MQWHLFIYSYVITNQITEHVLFELIVHEQKTDEVVPLNRRVCYNFINVTETKLTPFKK